MRNATRRRFAGLAVLAAALVLMSTMFNLATPTSNASSHREAPAISEDPAADNTDLYAFVSPDAPDTVTIISNYYPGQDPAGGPNFYKFGDDVIYDINIDNNGDAVEDITYRFDFSSRYTNPDVPLITTGEVTSMDDPDLNLRQSYTVDLITADGTERLPIEGVVPVPNIGPLSTPNYEDLAESAIVELDGMQIFAGQRDDPFWVDLGAVFDLVTIRGEEGIDALRGFNVLTIAVQVPIADLTATGEAPTAADDPNAIIGLWSTASRFSTTVINADGTRTGEGDLVQVSRLGMPLVNEVVVPVGAKDLFNASHPSEDAQFLGGVLNPVLPGVLNARYGIAVPEGDRNDLVTVFLTGIPGLNQPANVVPSEQLRLNMAIPPAAEENPFGVIAGDNAGFPNGRRLGDEVIDIELRVVAGILFADEFNVAPNNALDDGVDANDKGFLTSFPYVASPHQGFEHRHHPSKPSESATDDDDADAAESVTIDLNELSDSGVSGTATLTANGEQTDVAIAVTGATGGHPVHIHTGTCDTLGEVVHGLTDIDANGESVTTVDTSLTDLLDGEFAINAHLSAEEISVYVACGNIEA